MSDVVVAGFTFPTHRKHTHDIHTVCATANSPARARVRSAGGGHGGVGVDARGRGGEQVIRKGGGEERRERCHGAVSKKPSKLASLPLRKLHILAQHARFCFT